jgi:putative polyhydroxyalkanoate system protein
MSTVEIRRKHDLDADACRHAREELAQFLREQMGASVQQGGEQLAFAGKGFNGSVTIAPGLACCNIKLGLLARPFKRQLETEINRQLDARLGAQ